MHEDPIALHSTRAAIAAREHLAVSDGEAPPSEAGTVEFQGQTCTASIATLLDRMQRQLEIVGHISQSPALFSGDVEALAREITELAAATMKCERVNAWVFNGDETELHCIDLYEATPARHSAGNVLLEREYRAEFLAIKSAKYVNADDPLTDPRTAGYVESYLKPLGITSMLDAVIHASGRNLGLLCFEHVGKAHHWETDEIGFACQLADKIGIALVSRDRNRAEDKIRSSEAALAEAQAVAHVGSWDFELVARRLSWSAETYRIYGVEPGHFEPSYEAWLALAHPEDRAAMDAGYVAAVANRTEVAIDHRIVRPDGSIRLVHERGRTFYGADGRPLRSVGTVQDITERKLVEEKLRRERDFSAALIDAVPGILFVLDSKGRKVQVNANLSVVTGLPREGLLGMEVRESIAPEDRGFVREKMKEVLERGQAEAQFGVLHRNGSIRTFVVSGRKIELEGGPGILGIGVDVTEARRAEKLLRESEERFRGLIENTVDWVWEMDADFRYTYASPRSIDLFGYRPDELVGRSAFDFMSPDDAARTMAETAELFAKRRPMLSYVTTFIHKTGRKLITETNATPFFDADGRYCGYRGIDRDITERIRISAALFESEAKFRTVFNSVADAIFIYDARSGVFVDVNRAGCEMHGYARDEIIGKGLDVISSGAENYTAADGAIWDEKAKLHGPQRFEWQSKAKDGHLLWTEVTLRSATLGGEERMLASVRDISVRRQAIDALKESEARFRAVAETAQDAIVLIDGGGAFRFWNGAAERIFGYSAAEARSMRVHDVIASKSFRIDANVALEFANTGAGDGLGKTVEISAIRKDGREIPVELSLAHILIGSERNAVAVIRDITDRKRNEERILQLARFDALTGLANRTVFAEGVQLAIARAQRGGKGFAVLYLDLDHFKDVNDTLGHPIGDQLLKSVAERLRAAIRETDTVARFGGDEFAVLAADIEEPADAGILGAKLLKAISEPVVIDGNEIRSGTSVGISVYGPDSPDPEILLSHADVALYRAKSEGRGTFRFFTDAMDDEVRSRVTLDGELRIALAERQLYLAYQPQIDLQTGRIVGVEALVRWRHPQRGIVSPAEFIPAAEKNGLIVPLGRWVLHEACRQARAWREAGLRPVVMAVNLSALQFKTPKELERDIAAALAQNVMAPDLLELELTETVLMEASREHGDALARLRKLGVRLAIDDFGTGYSSLDYLRRFPADRIKIAQNFIRDLLVTPGDAAIVKATIGLARELDINVIAEGVETEEQLKLLRSWGCREAQGYYFARPVEADAAAELLRSGIVHAGERKTAAIGARAGVRLRK